jgi:membrane protease YdiL (CAAX protease family)
MYIAQGYRGNLGLWKYLFIPIGFIGFMLLNYIAVLMSDEPVDVMMNQMIEMVGKNAVLAINLGFLAIGLFVVLGWTKLVHPQSITSLTTSRKKIDWGRIFTSFFIWGTITTVFTLVSVYYIAPEEYVNNFDTTKFLILLPIAIILVPLQTSFEEYLFRGYMMQGLGIWAKNKWLPLLVTSVLFGLMHIANPEIGKIGYVLLVYYIGTGFFLGIMTLMDEGLELALGFHAANNLFGVLLVTYDWGALQADAIFKNIAMAEGAVLSEILVPVFVVFPILLFIFSKLYRWTNWKERLFGKVMDKEEFLAIENGDSSQVQA